MTQDIERRRVLGIVGSPRRGGNTEIMVDEVLAGAEEAGALTEKAILNELTIAPCQGCYICERTGKCAQQDDMQALSVQMANSQLWVFGTPIYWWGPSGQFKVFMDRCLGAKDVTFKGQPVVLVMPLSSEDAHGARHTIGMIEDALHKCHEAKLVDVIVAPGVLEAGEVRNFPDVLAKARQMGRIPIEAM